VYIEQVETYAKLARLALPLIAGCVALGQGSSQGAGTYSGARANEPRVSRSHPLISFLNQFKGFDFSQNAYPFPFFKKGELFTPYVNRAVRTIAQSSLKLSSLRVNETDIAYDPAKIGGKIRAVIQEEFSDDWSKMKQLDREWLVAEGVCEFVKRNIKYQFDPIPEEKVRDYADPKFLLKMRDPTAVCWGISVLTRDIARGAGLKCDFVSCNGRDMNFQKPAPGQVARTHGIVCFTLGGWEIGADVTDTVRKFHQEQWNQIAGISDRKVRSLCVLPRDAYALELFHAAVNANLTEDMEVSSDKQNKHLLFTGLTYDEWANLTTDYKSYLSKLLTDYDKWEMAGRN